MHLFGFDSAWPHGFMGTLILFKLRDMCLSCAARNAPPSLLVQQANILKEQRRYHLRMHMYIANLQ